MLISPVQPAVQRYKDDDGRYKQGDPKKNTYESKSIKPIHTRSVHPVSFQDKRQELKSTLKLSWMGSGPVALH